MIGKLKKIVGTDGDGVGGGALAGIPSGVKVMGAHLQRKFARGVQYNMKVIIKGERNTGKSTLLYRLQGYKFVSDYNQTEEIQVAVIHWTAATSATEVVKVDVWDIVDKGKCRRKNGGLKLSNDPSGDDKPKPNQHMEACLDADFLDVYQGTHAVIFVFDICKQWTYDYVIKNLPLVPHEIPVLVMANFMDNQENRVVGEPTGMKRMLKSAANRPLIAAPVVVIESSLKDGFGLKMVHQFFNLPFLSLQRKSLNQMLETNKQNQLKINDFFRGLDDTGNKEVDYGVFLEKVEERRTKTASLSLSSPDKGVSPSHSAIFNNASSANVSPSKHSAVTDSQKQPGTSEGIGSKLTRMFSKRQKSAPIGSKDASANQPENLDNFLSGNQGADGEKGGTKKRDPENSDDNENENPMVDGFFEDFASDENPCFEVPDKELVKETKKSKSVKARKISSSSEEEEVEKPQTTQQDLFAPMPDIITDDLDPFQNNQDNDFELMFVTDASPEHTKPKQNKVPKPRKISTGSEASDEEQQYEPQIVEKKTRSKKQTNVKGSKKTSKKEAKTVSGKKTKLISDDSSDDEGVEGKGGRGNMSSTTTSEGGEVLSDDSSQYSLPSDDPEGDDNFKQYIRNQAKPNIQQLNEVSVVMSKAASKLPARRRQKKSSERVLMSDTGSSGTDNEKGNLDEKTEKGGKKSKQQVHSFKNGRDKIPDCHSKNRSSINDQLLERDDDDDDDDDEDSKVNPLVNTNYEENDLDVFFAHNNKDVQPNEALEEMPDVDYLPVGSQEKPNKANHVVTPQNTVKILDGTEQEDVDNSLASPTLNLMLNSGELDFLETVAVNTKPKKEPTDKKKKTKKQQDNDADEPKKSKAGSKNKDGKNQRKTSKSAKSGKGLAVLLDFEEPSLENNEEPLVADFEKSDELEATEKKKGKSKKKVDKGVNGEKKTKKKAKKERPKDGSSSEANQGSPQNNPTIQFQNDGYESL